jgi:hypothetical protein
LYVSAETMIPRSLEKLERVGCRKEVVGLVMPSDFSFNMDGTAIYMTMAVLCIARWLQPVIIGRAAARAQAGFDSSCPNISSMKPRVCGHLAGQFACRCADLDRRHSLVR